MNIGQSQIVSTSHYKDNITNFPSINILNSIHQLLQYFMNNPHSTYSKLSNASAKLSTRRIFTKSNGSNQNGGGGGSDLFRIAAKIRELEDDVKSILAENAVIEGKNKELIRVLDELQYVVNVQQLRVDELTKCLRKDIEAGDSIADFEEDLKTVAQQINTLNYMITQKNDQYEVIKAEKEDLQYDSIRLKEQANHLQYDFNVAHADLDCLIDDDEDQPTDLQQKARIIFRRCEQISEQLAKCKQEIEQGSKQNAERLLLEKEKRYKLEYEVRLLRERKTDQLKKENYFRAFYDQERIQEVIDDMLRKQDTLRKQIAQQEEENLRQTQEWDQQIMDIERQSQRQRLQREEQIRLKALQLQILTKQIQDLTQEHTEISQRLESSQVQGIEMESFQEQMDSDLWQRIRATEQQNLHLQSQFQKLSSQVGLLQRSLAL